MKANIKPGIYRHFEGNIYQVLSVGTHSENNEPMVTYQALYGDCETFVRPLSMWTKERFQPFDINTLEYFYDKVALLSIKNGKVLMARSKGVDKFYMPGGKREKGETDIQCLVRECREELGIEIDTKAVFHYGTYFAYGHVNKPPARLIIYQANFSGKPKASREIEEVKYLGYKDRPKTVGAGKTLLNELYWKRLVN